MDFSLLADPSLVFISLIAGVVALATSLNIAARPAAVKTAKVMLAFTMANFFFMLTRFANLFYAPLMAKFVDTAASTGNTGLLAGQLRWVILGSALGGLASWICLNTFIEIYRRGIICIEHRQSLARALLRLAHPRAWKVLLGAVRKPSNLGVKLFKLEGIPVGFLLANVFATAVWTVGVMAALLVSAELPGMEQTAVLLSGLVNAFAAIAFSVWVDPKAAVITDQAIRGERPQKHVDITAVHLSMGNFLGGLLGLMMLNPAASLIRVAAKSLGEQGETMNNNLWIIVLFNLAFAFLASTTYASRISAVRTARAATAVAVYNFFFLIARLGQQVFAPMIGAISDHVTANPNLGLPDLAVSLRFVLLGASLGALLSWLFMPTLVEVYDQAFQSSATLPVTGKLDKQTFDELARRKPQPGKRVWEDAVAVAFISEAPTVSNKKARVLIDLSEHRLSVYDGAGKVQRVFPVASGARETPTDEGIKVVCEKLEDPTKLAEKLWPDSKGAAFGKRLIDLNWYDPETGSQTVSDEELHGTYELNSIGSFASHGCVRLTNESIEWLYQNLKLGDIVVIRE